MNATTQIVETKESEINNQLASLEVKLSGLEDYSNRLKEALGPVLNQNTPPLIEKSDKLSSCVSSLGQHFYCFNNRLEVVCDILSDILDGCQL